MGEKSVPKGKKSVPNGKKSEPKVKEVISVGEEEPTEEDETTEEDLKNLTLENKWWLQEPYRTLLDPELAKNIDLARYDLSELIENFTERMLKEDLIDFRISGLAIYSSAKLYHQKITGVIHEEEEIQKQELRRRMRRQIPKAISQPIREVRKIATSEELFDSMRRAIIETMQNREKLRIRRIRRQEKKEKLVKRKGKGRLPAELLKHITGKKDTIEQRLQQRQRQIKEIINMESPQDSIISINYLKNLIYSQHEDKLGKHVEYLSCFQELLFLASLNKISLIQENQSQPIRIKVLDKTGVRF